MFSVVFRPPLGFHRKFDPVRCNKNRADIALGHMSYDFKCLEIMAESIELRYRHYV